MDDTLPNRLPKVQKRKPEEVNEGGICELPEGCITNILSLTSPRHACISSLVSSMFKSAADSDVVWEKFLPLDYQEIISAFLSPLNLADFSSKKNLFFHLCSHPFILDGGNKSFSLQKKSGKKCFMFGSKELDITWGLGDTPQDARQIANSNSRFGEVAILASVWWFEIEGKVQTWMLSPNTTYAAHLVIKFGDRTRELAYSPTKVSVGFVGGGGLASETRSAYFHPTCERSPYPRDRGDGWMEIELGEFYNDHREDQEVLMALKELNTDYVKRDVLIEGIELRPK